jgi:iron complex outermembrane receptor protein
LGTIKNTDEDGMGVPSDTNIKKYLRMKTFLSFFLFSILVVNAIAADGSAESASATVNSSKIISGKITDKNTGEGLAGVEIKLMDSDKKTYTDFEGNFVITNVETGAQAIITNYISYGKMVKNVFVGDNKSEQLEITLEQVKK